ncbi:MAG: hypothetical protein WD894_02855 [Pirellulales bacterium]
MILGTVSADGVPTINLDVAGQTFSAIVDTGFNGDLELPLELRDLLNARYVGKLTSVLAAGQRIQEDVYRLDFPFDGREVTVNVTFAAGSEILIGTRLLKQYQLEINSKMRTLLLDRA